MAPPTCSVACLQLAQEGAESREERIIRVLDLVTQGPAADLVVLPELWDVGYFAFDDYATAARALPDGAMAGLQTVARARETVVVGGSVVERAGSNLYNTIAVAGPDGALLGSYRKRHLFGYQSQEANLLSPGRSDVVVDTPAGRLGLSTCFDLRFPEQFAAMRAAGADVLVVPAAWPAARAEHWSILTSARAIETQTPVVAVNGVGPSGGVELAGRSRVIDGRGRVLAEGGDGHPSGVGTGVERPVAAPSATWITATIDHRDTERWRSEFPVRAATITG